MSENPDATAAFVSPELPDSWGHIYGQGAWHSEAVIEGTRTALTRIRDAIDRALTSGQDASSDHIFAGDGEGYTVLVRVRNAGYVRESRLPYVDEIARETCDRKTG